LISGEHPKNLINRHHATDGSSLVVEQRTPVIPLLIFQLYIESLLAEQKTRCGWRFKALTAQGKQRREKHTRKGKQVGESKDVAASFHMYPAPKVSVVLMPSLKWENGRLRPFCNSTLLIDHSPSLRTDPSSTGRRSSSSSNFGNLMMLSRNNSRDNDHKE